MKTETLKRKTVRRAMRLLNMEYKPSEIAEELGVSLEVIYSMVKRGLPVRKDNAGRLWLNGKATTAWILDVAPKSKKEAKKPGMAIEQAFCMKCKSAVTYQKTKTVGNLVYGLCPLGHSVTRFVRRK